MAGQADDADAMDRTLDLSQQPRQRRIGLGLATKEGDVDASGEPLVDLDGDVLTVLQRLRELERGVTPGRNQRSHLHRAQLFYDAVSRRTIGPTKQDRGIQPVGD